MNNAEGTHSRKPPKPVRHTNPITDNVNKQAHTQCYTFNCYHANAQSIKNKFHEFQVQVESFKPKIIGITESWCNSDIGDGEINLDFYNMFRSDRKESIGGGVLMYTYEDLPAIPCQDMIDLEIEDSMWVSVKLNDKDMMLVGIVYRTQKSSDENNIKIIDVVRIGQQHWMRDMAWTSYTWTIRRPSTQFPTAD